LQLGIHKTGFKIFAQGAIVARHKIHILHESKGIDRYIRVKFENLKPNEAYDDNNFYGE
jgi:hypothetical protein